MWIRWHLCPLVKLASYVPQHGVIVDLGCGHGLFSQLLATESSMRDVIGVDLDADKILLAQQIHLPNLRFIAGNITEVDLPPAQAITILDVLYLLPPAAQEHLLAVCAEKLSPDGVILLKDVAERPRWKFWLTWLEEILAVYVLKITMGTDRLYFRPRADWEALFRKLGFVVETIPLDRGYYHPHVVFVARKTSHATTDR